MKTISSIRAYVSGESLWSKSQKVSVYHINRYAKTHAESDYQQFLKAMEVPLGDKLTRTELQKPKPNLDLAKQGLIQGGNNPDDVPGMMMLFMVFQHTSLLKPSIQYWAEGDQLIAQTIQLADQVHRHIRAGETAPEIIDPLIDQINDINLQLTPLEDAFSSSIGEASVKAQALIILFMLIVTMILMTLGILSSRKLVLRDAAYLSTILTSEERWKFALEGARDGVWDWHILTGEVKYSSQWKAMLGYREDELDDSLAAWQDMLHPEELAKVLAALKAYVTGKTDQYSIEHRLKCKDGSYKWILARGKVVSYTKEGKSERMVGTHTDIDEIKRVEASLRESDANQRALLEAMVDGVFVAQDYRFIFANPALPKMLGYRYEEFIGISFDQVIAPDYLELWNQRFTARISEEVEPVKSYQVKFMLKGGQQSIWLDLHASRVDFRGKRSVLGILRDISKQKEAEDLIWQQANFDSLTNLPNRRMFRDRLEQEIKNSERAGSALAVMFLDLDHFKEVNDTLGHGKGDTLLCEVAKRLKACVRETDTVARLGGDEFVIMLKQVEDSTGLDKVAKGILTQLLKPFEIGLDPIYISASIGITLYPIDATEFEELLKNADQAMYAAKDEGRNRYSYFTSSMQTAAKARMRMANDLRQACEKNEFKLVYQPIIEIASGEIRKAEALIRWHHPTLGLINPGQFIAIAEDTGIIFEIGEWVFHQALLQAAKWRKSLHAEFQISINKSPIQFKNEDDAWPKQLAEAGLPGQSVAVEITEGLLLDASDVVTDRLKALGQAGIQIAIDDFGTGYSSLSYLKRYDIDYIKIDQSFVRNIGAGSNDMGLCEAIILMAHKLGMKVIAEGVETRAQLMLLAEAGCDYAQGYFFSKPVSDKEFEKFIRNANLGSNRLNA
ncbi:MAG: bifunctional diguanylate cyclase/phosphodiesterase [Methylophilaceae bacterium]